jgi:predicted nucleic acid-binding protein
VTASVVIDASAAVEIGLNTARGRALARLLPPKPALWAPEHFFAEVASGIRRLEIVERRIDASTAAESLRKALLLPRRRVNVRPLIEEAWTYRFNITVGDALYVVVAKHLDCPLLTGDGRLASAPNLPVSVLHLAVA